MVNAEHGGTPPSSPSPDSFASTVAVAVAVAVAVLLRPLRHDVMAPGQRLLFALSVVCGAPVRVPPVLLLSFKNVLSILERARKIIEAVPSPTAPLTQ